MLRAWVAFPLVLALVGGGWGLVCNRALRSSLPGPLVVPFGLAAVTVLAGILTSFSASAVANVPIVAAVAAVGLLGSVARRVRERRLRRLGLDWWAVAAAVVAVVLAGAPVIASGEPTFAGYLKLDDTATWLSIVDRVMTHGRSLGGLASSTYALNLHAYLSTMGYPLGAFLPLGIGRALVGGDVAWLFQPYLACCVMLIALGLYALITPLITSRPTRALLAVLSSQAPLLYGYGQWGGIKELTGAFLLVVLAAVIAAAFTSIKGAARRRAATAVAIVSAAIAGALGPGAVAWLGPALMALAGRWLLPACRYAWRQCRRPAAGMTVRPGRDGIGKVVARMAGGDAGPVGLLALLTALLMLPMWLQLNSFLVGSGELFSSVSGGAIPSRGGLASLYHPLTALQLAGPWPVGDFRLTAPAAATAPLLIAVLVGLVLAFRARPLRPAFGLLAYAAITLLAALIVWQGGAIAWVVAKALAMAAPALPTLALVGCALLWQRQELLARAFGAVLVALIGGGILVSDALAYHDVTLAPRARLAELDQLAPLLPGHTPTFVNEYDPYADRHFLRGGDPTEPAEYRTDPLQLSAGVLLTQSAWVDLDGFPVRELEYFPSIVTRTSPVASRPPSIYTLRYQGRYYQLWQRPTVTTDTIIEHVPLGDSGMDSYCGRSTTGYRALCPVQPASIAPCRLVGTLAAQARTDHGWLVAYQRPVPIVARADESQWPAPWILNPYAHTLVPTTPGTVVMHIRLRATKRYRLWLGGSFARGFAVSIDGQPLGSISDELANIGEYFEIGVRQLGSGVHTLALRYPSASPFTPGSGSEFTELSTVVLEPLGSPASRLISVGPGQASELCGRTLDWLEVVARTHP